MSLVFTLMPRGPVTRVERLAVESWLSHGYEVRAYTYEQLDHQNRGVTCGTLPNPANFDNAESILPEPYLQQKDGLLAFKLNAWHAHGGLFLPPDYVLQQALPATGHLCGRLDDGELTFELARIPQDSPVLGALRRTLYKVDKRGLPLVTLGEAFATAITDFPTAEALEQLKLSAVVRSSGHLVVRARGGLKLSADAFGARLWPDMWDRETRAHNTKFPETVLFERLWSIFFGASAHDELEGSADDDSDADAEDGPGVQGGSGSRLHAERRVYGLPSRLSSVLRTRGDF